MEYERRGQGSTSGCVSHSLRFAVPKRTWRYLRAVAQVKCFILQLRGILTTILLFAHESPAVNFEALNPKTLNPEPYMQIQFQLDTHLRTRQGNSGPETFV